MVSLRPFLHGLLCASAFAAATTRGTAQCPFDPTITPSAPILCPNTQEVLMTEVYDAYQWYKDGSPVPGATAQSLVVDAFLDGGSQFSVEATLAGCVEMSPQILVDGWAFLPPTVMTVGTLVGITPDWALYCEDAPVMLVMLPPYDTNIQWTEGGNPIPGETDDTLVVTTGGQYSASGAPAICPDYHQSLGVQIGIILIAPIQPDIVPNDGQLCAYPTGYSYQWYFNGLPMSDSDTSCIDAAQPGSYEVDVTYGPDCSIISEPFIITGLPLLPDPTAWLAFPLPAREQVTVRWSDGSTIDGWRMRDVTGREVLRHDGPTRSPLMIDVRGLRTGRYWLTAPGKTPIAIPIVD